MFAILSLASAIFYGAADFLGGLATRHANTVTVVVISQLAGLVALAVALPLLPDASPSQLDYLWGAAAGLSGGVGVALLYKALAIGTMAVVAPVTAVCAVALPVVGAIALGERPGPVTFIGIGLAILSIWLVSQHDVSNTGRAAATWRNPPYRDRGLGLALASGVAIGLFFWSLAQPREEAGLWPLVAARTVSITLFGTLAVGRGAGLRLARRPAAIAIGGGTLDMLANVLYLVATRDGPLSVVVTLSSLYPASTVVLARAVLGERLSARQTSGVVCALAAVAIVVAGR